MKERIAQALDRARMSGRLLSQTGLLRTLRPRGFWVMIQQRRAGGVGPSTIYRLHAANQPDKEALVTAEGRMSYRTLDDRIDRLAAGLRNRLGLQRTDAVVLAMHNRAEFLEAQSAMSRIGGRAVSASWRSTPAELQYFIEHSEARAVLVEAEVADNVSEIRDQLTRVPAQNIVTVGGERDGLTSYEQLLAEPPDRYEEDSEGGAVIIYTSGTTGKPKGAMRSFPKESTETILRFLLETPLRTDDRHLAVCPMYHSTAFGFIGFTMLLGGTTVIERHFDPERFLAMVEREQITSSAVVPTMLHRILDLPKSTREKYDTSTLRAVFTGGSALSGALARRFIEEFGPVLYNFYGSTETGVNTLATPDELLRSPGTIGHLVPGNEIRLLDDQGNEVPRGETGELYVRNAVLVNGYYRDDEATRKSMHEGFFSVGDLAHVDENGLFHIDGRRRDMIISGGVNVYPVEVEEALRRHPDVAEAAVVGIPDDEWGERVRAFVELHAGATSSEADLVAWAKRELSGAKIPRELIIVDELPKNPTGKVLKRELRNWQPRPEQVATR